MTEQAIAFAPTKGMHPLSGAPRAVKPRFDIGAMAAQWAEAQKQQRRVHASYDAAADGGTMANYWSNSDAYDADSANSKTVRSKLVQRSRYEVNNNGYADGIATTYATDVVGAAGPGLRMQTNSEGFNQMVETEWALWCKAVKFRRKLWCMAHAKHQDGEGIGIVRRNPRVKHRIKLDPILYETEQCQTPYLPFNERGRIDGIKFDEFGNPTIYEFLKEHPGSVGGFPDFEPEQVPAQFVLHWFKMRRPGQHRGIPECASTLNAGAAGRRWREATLSTAEKVARFTLFLKTMLSPDEAAAAVPMSTFDIADGMMTALPDGYDPFQLKAEHPGPNHAEFLRSLVAEQARPKSMPYNRAAADSSNSNFASGKLDFLPYFQALDVDREDCNDAVLDPLFELWFDTAILTYGWLGGNPDAISAGARSHVWDWPKHTIGDDEVEANANAKHLATGALSPSAMCAKNGDDFDDVLIQLAENYGVTPENMRAILLKQNFPVAAQVMAQVQAQSQSSATEVPSGEAV